jgi:glutaconate CoA-transferase, subunit A
MNKAMCSRDVVARLRSGMTLGIGGWGPRRKPMSLVREILRSDLKDLTVVCYGGPEAGMLCAAGKVRRLVYGFVSMDAIPLEPHFRKARESGQLEVMELDEGMLQWGLRAAAMRMSFLPTRCGLATDVLARNPQIKTICSPYDDEVYLAMPALKLDAALLHVNDADRLGNTLIRSADPLFDHLFARAAETCYISAERLHERLELDGETARFNLFERSLVTGVVAAPFGAHPTYSSPDYGWDLEHLRRYSAGAAEAGGWEAYAREFISCTDTEYLAKAGGPERIRSLDLPVF